MDTRITATDLAKNLSDVLNRVRYRGESFLVLRNGEALATLAPAQPSRGITLRELASHFEELPRPDEGFAEDVEAVQSSQPRAGTPPWPC